MRDHNSNELCELKRKGKWEWRWEGNEVFKHLKIVFSHRLLPGLIHHLLSPSSHATCKLTSSTVTVSNLQCYPKYFIFIIASDANCIQPKWTLSRRIAQTYNTLMWSNFFVFYFFNTKDPACIRTSKKRKHNKEQQPSMGNDPSSTYT